MPTAATPSAADGGTPRVLVIGGGFAGLQTVRGLRRAPVRITLLDRRNFTLFQPLLYQVATGLLSPANIATPLRQLFARQANAQVLLGEVTGFDLAAKRVRLADRTLDYDHLVVACGARHHYFGNPEWERHAPGLKSLEDAEDVRRRILLALEGVERTADPAERRRGLTFVVVGGGPTSVELAGAVGEILRHAVGSGFRSLAHGGHRILLVEADDRLLGSFSIASSEEAARALRSLGVEVRLRCRVVRIDGQGVALEDADGRQEIAAATVLWGAGVRASPLAALLAAAAGAAPGPGGRVAVVDDCTLPGHPEVFALGDMAAFLQDGRPLPGTAQVAMQQGDHAAKAIAARIAGRTGPLPFRYRDRGSMATIGRRLAVADIGSWHLRGRLAWVIWLALHLMKLVRSESRILVLIQWAWSYATWRRSASLVTGEDPDRRIPGDVRHG